MTELQLEDIEMKLLSYSHLENDKIKATLNGIDKDGQKYQFLVESFTMDELYDFAQFNEESAKREILENDSRLYGCNERELFVGKIKSLTIQTKEEIKPVQPGRIFHFKFKVECTVIINNQSKYNVLFA